MPSGTRAGVKGVGRKSARRSKAKPGQPDWASIRHEREINGLRWSDSERRFGVSRQRVQRRAVREGWRNPGEVVQKATEDFARRFVARESEAILECYRVALDASRRVMALAIAQIEALERAPLNSEPGVLKDLAEIIRKSHVVQSEIGGLNRREDGWRSSHGTDEADVAPASARVRKALAGIREVGD